MPFYDTLLFDPPAPVARVALKNPNDAKSVAEVPMLLDTGADVTLIPISQVSQIGLNVTSDEVYELLGFDGNLSVASVVRLEMQFQNKTFKGKFLLIDQEWGVIGRDILNLISLGFDGPKLFWDAMDHKK